MTLTLWMIGWLVGWWLVPHGLARGLPPRQHRVWRPIAQRLLRWPLYPTRAQLLAQLRCPCCAVWARPALTLLDVLFWPWFVAVAAWETRDWRVLARLTPDADEQVPGSDELHPPGRSES